MKLIKLGASLGADSRSGSQTSCRLRCGVLASFHGGVGAPLPCSVCGEGMRKVTLGEHRQGQARPLAHFPYALSWNSPNKP